jgi:copper chaperone CopZ
MKDLISLIMLVAMSGLLAQTTPAFSDDAAKPAAKAAAAAAGNTVKVKIAGMVCAFCAQGISKNFKARPEVKSVDVNLDNKIVTLALNEGKTLPDDPINQIIKDAGYKVVEIQR